MKIKELSIKNFRGIENLEKLELSSLSILIGNNGTSKTSVLEAINYILSPSFLSGRIKITDFNNGGESPIEIKLIFTQTFIAHLPDGWNKQDVECKGLFLKIKKRDRASNSKAFSDLVVVEHYVIPNIERNKSKGWTVNRKGGKPFSFDERLLSFPVETTGLLRSYYYGKNREKQIQRGFNSSLNSVFDDFNWRFAKTVRKENSDASGEETYLSRKIKLEEEINQKVDDKALNKTFDSLNQKLKNLGIDPVNVSIFDSQTPFDSAYLSKRQGDVEIPVSMQGSGVEMIISLLFLETLASLNKEKFVIIIDEPELHLHPSMQQKFMKFLTELSSEIQIIISTHSPYFFNGIYSNENLSLIIHKVENKILEIEGLKKGKGLFPWSPTWAEINHKAFQIESDGFHNELYGRLQELMGLKTITQFDNELKRLDSQPTLNWQRENGNVDSVTLHTYIRNSIHHPENNLNPDFTESQLKSSTEFLISLLVANSTSSTAPQDS